MAPKETRRSQSGRILYTIWNLWKEQNRRIFNGTRLAQFEVAALVFEEINQWDLAFGEGRDSEGIG